jgi:hypothetical protein
MKAIPAPKRPLIRSSMVRQGSVRNQNEKRPVNTGLRRVSEPAPTGYNPAGTLRNGKVMLGQYNRMYKKNRPVLTHYGHREYHDFALAGGVLTGVDGTSVDTSRADRDQRAYGMSQVGAQEGSPRQCTGVCSGYRRRRCRGEILGSGPALRSPVDNTSVPTRRFSIIVLLFLRLEGKQKCGRVNGRHD